MPFEGQLTHSQEANPHAWWAYWAKLDETISAAKTDAAEGRAGRVVPMRRAVSGASHWGMAALGEADEDCA
ncbi:MAG: hypothetical protein EBZ69_04065 [Alphaproteobacteria bacterium]|nr:hypothetical protein [Alphaproteobacteria bacterium]NDC55973.1 hypothetical protein [Alphaproteobacteria bacterium]NDG04907.1 hypothetical protein [Alphaproteobacteria bacterium]